MLRKFFRSLLALIFVSVLLLLAQGCSKSSSPTSPSPTPPPPNSVSIVDFAFSPASITVDSGVTVTWTNNGATTHTVTSDGSGLFSSGNITPGGTYTHAFVSKGTFGYHCSIHPQMTASITVK